MLVSGAYKLAVTGTGVMTSTKQFPHARSAVNGRTWL